MCCCFFKSEHWSTCCLIELSINLEEYHLTWFEQLCWVNFYECLDQNLFGNTRCYKYRENVYPGLAFSLSKIRGPSWNRSKLLLQEIVITRKESESVFTSYCSILTVLAGRLAIFFNFVRFYICEMCCFESKISRQFDCSSITKSIIFKETNVHLVFCIFDWESHLLWNPEELLLIRINKKSAGLSIVWTRKPAVWSTRWHFLYFSENHTQTDKAFFQVTFTCRAYFETPMSCPV